MPSEAAEVHRRIVVGVDGSDSSKQALEWAARQAELTGSTLEVVTTWEWPASYGLGLEVPSDYDPTADARTVLEQTLEPVREARPEVKVDLRVLEGHPAKVLIDASRGADLLVVGSRGHGQFSGMLVGSVSEHCVAHAHCPVLVLREED